MDENKLESIEIIRGLVEGAIVTHNVEYMTHLINKMLTEYVELATLATDGKYNKDWTHMQVLNYITYGYGENDGT
jgi:hypothetical protein